MNETRSAAAARTRRVNANMRTLGYMVGVLAERAAALDAARGALAEIDAMIAEMCPERERLAAAVAEAQKKAVEAAEPLVGGVVSEIIETGDVLAMREAIGVFERAGVPAPELLTAYAKVRR